MGRLVRSLHSGNRLTPNGLWNPIDLTIIPISPDALFVGGTTPGQNYRVYYSTDGGTSWMDISDGLPTYEGTRLHVDALMVKVR